jgi:hypothetical protein
MNSTNWAAEGNKQSKQQTCLSLALFVPFRNPARTMHAFSLAFSCVGPLCFWFALHVHHPRTISPMHVLFLSFSVLCKWCSSVFCLGCAFSPQPNQPRSQRHLACLCNVHMYMYIYMQCIYNIHIQYTYTHNICDRAAAAACMPTGFTEYSL